MHIPGWDTNYIYCECACKINLFGKRLYSGSSWALNCLALALLQSELFKQKHKRMLTENDIIYILRLQVLSTIRFIYGLAMHLNRGQNPAACCCSSNSRLSLGCGLCASFMKKVFRDYSRRADFWGLV